MMFEKLNLPSTRLEFRWGLTLLFLFASTTYPEGSQRVPQVPSVWSLPMEKRSKEKTTSLDFEFAHPDLAFPKTLTTIISHFTTTSSPSLPVFSRFSVHNSVGSGLLDGGLPVQTGSFWYSVTTMTGDLRSWGNKKFPSTFRPGRGSTTSGTTPRVPFSSGHRLVTSRHPSLPGNQTWLLHWHCEWTCSHWVKYESTLTRNPYFDPRIKLCSRRVWNWTPKYDSLHHIPNVGDQGPLLFPLSSSTVLDTTRERESNGERERTRDRGKQRCLVARVYSQRVVYVPSLVDKCRHREDHETLRSVGVFQGNPGESSDRWVVLLEGSVSEFKISFFKCLHVSLFFSPTNQGSSPG